MLFLKADIKGALIQSDSGINTIPNLIDPSTKSFNYTPRLRWAPRTEGEAQGNNLSPSLQNEGDGAETMRENAGKALWRWKTQESDDELFNQGGAMARWCRWNGL